MTAIWKLQDAKNRFSEVVERALSHAPQAMTRRRKTTGRPGQINLGSS